MGFFWLGADEGFETYADACHSNGYVWLGAEQGFESYADARYRDGYVWLGAEEGFESYADARYRGGYVWLGAEEGFESYADARYRDGYVWLGAEEGFESYADARYKRSGGAAAAETLLLLLNANSGSSNDDSPAGQEADETELEISSSSSGRSEQHVGTSTSGSGTSSGPGFLGWVVIVICAVIGLDVLRENISKQGSPNVKKAVTVVAEPPQEIVDRGVCPFEGCTYGERWLARKTVTVYTAPPNTVEYSMSSLHRAAIVHAGQWVRTETGLILVKRHDGVVSAETRFGIAVKNPPPLRPSQVIPLYSYLGEGCWTGWIGGHTFPICTINDTEKQLPNPQWWIKVSLRNGVKGWTSAADKAFISEEDLNSELGKKIEDSELPLDSKLSQIDALIKEGANLNGSGGRYGTTPIQAAIERRDVELLKLLLQRGMNFQSEHVCAAYTAANIALQPGGDFLLDFLLQNGVHLDCLHGPPLNAFLRPGIATENYPVDRAIQVARILIEHGASIHDKDSQGESIFDVLDQSKNYSLINPLREALKEPFDYVPHSSGKMEGAYRAGGGVSQPAVLYKVDPEYSEEARKARYSGTVLVSLVVNPEGKASNIKVVRSLGLGLDEKAMEAVAKWKFKPGMKDGSPVPVMATIEVNFRLL